MDGKKPRPLRNSNKKYDRPEWDSGQRVKNNIYYDKYTRENTKSTPARIFTEEYGKHNIRSSSAYTPIITCDLSSPAEPEPQPAPERIPTPPQTPPPKKEMVSSYLRENAIIKRQRKRFALGFYIAFSGIGSSGKYSYVFGSISDYRESFHEEFDQWLFVNFIEISDEAIIRQVISKIKKLAKEKKEYSYHGLGFNCISTEDIDVYIWNASNYCLEYVKSRQYEIQSSTIPFGSYANTAEELTQISDAICKYQRISMKRHMLKMAKSIEDIERISLAIERMNLQ